MVSKEEIREAMKLLCNIEPQDVDQALDSLVKDGLVEIKEKLE